jgi:hypothetical protein
MPAPLASILQALQSGSSQFSQDQLDYYGGKDAILSALRSFDPNAQLTETDIGGGEGGSQGRGFRFDYDPSKAPKSKGGTLGLDLRASNFGQLKNPNAVYDDAAYGKVTNSANVIKAQDPLWVKLAPLLVSLAAPMAGGALAGMGIGGAGLTAGVTGSGLGAASSLPSWATNLIGKAPNLARTLASGNFDPLALVAQYGGSAAGNALGVDPNVVKAGLSLGQLARKR